MVDLKKIRSDMTKEGGGRVTQAELAEMVGCTRVHIAYIEDGKTSPSVDMAKRIAAVCGFSWTEFFE